MEIDINMEAYLDSGFDVKIKKALRSCNAEIIRPFLPYLNTYVLSEGCLNPDAFSEVLKSQSKKAIESVNGLKQCLNTYVFKKGCIDHEAFRLVLRSRNKTAVEIITQYIITTPPHLNCLDRYYIHNKDGSLNDVAIGNILFSRCQEAIQKILPFLNDYVMSSPGNIVPERIKSVLNSQNKKSIEKILPYLDDYVMPTPGKINPKRIKSILNSNNSEAINKIFAEGYLTAYVKSSDKPGECLNELKVGKRMKRCIQENLNHAQSESIPSTFGPIENHLESLDFYPEAVNKNLDTQTPSSSQTHRKRSLSQLTSNEVEQTRGPDRFSDSIFSADFSNSFPEIPIVSINGNPFGVSIFSFYRPDVFDQSEDEKKVEKSMPLPGC